MSDLKISQLTALTAVAANAADVLPVVDTSATTTKKISLSDLTEFIAAASVITNLIPATSDDLSEGATNRYYTTARENEVLKKAIVDAKGDLIVATAADTPARLAVGGTNGWVLMVDSAETAGVKWAAVPASPVDSDQAILAGAVFN